MCKHGVNLMLVREDNTDQMQNQLVTFAEGVKKGENNPKDGRALRRHHGRRLGAQFLKGVDDRLGKLGPDYMAVVVGSAGYSRGEDKFMGPPAWRDNPQRARGGVVAGVLRDGDWNIALKWLGDNKIANNPDEKTYDPDALNWVNASDYIDAAQKYVSGYCAGLKNVKTGKSEKHCVDGVVTWTPGDVTVAEQKGGLVSIVSTEEYRSQMPNVIIGNKKWMAAHREIAKGMLSAIFEAGDRIKTDDAALREAAAVSARRLQGEGRGLLVPLLQGRSKENDKQGFAVELGGSSVNNLADNVQLFGLAPGSIDAFGATYTVFGNVVKSQYPELVPSFYSSAEITDLSYVKELYAAAPKTNADNASFSDDAKIKQVVSKKAWDIQFQTGSATFTGETQKQLAQLQDDLVVASGTMVEIHGHTDANGNADVEHGSVGAARVRREEVARGTCAGELPRGPRQGGRARPERAGRAEQHARRPREEPPRRHRPRHVRSNLSAPRQYRKQTRVERRGLANVVPEPRRRRAHAAASSSSAGARQCLRCGRCRRCATLPAPREVLGALGGSVVAGRARARAVRDAEAHCFGARVLARPLARARMGQRDSCGETRSPPASRSCASSASPGCSFPFTLATGGGFALKVALLTFGMTTFLVTSLARIVSEIPRSQIDYVRSLGASEPRVIWETVVRGTLDRTIDAVRQNVAMGWSMITMVEGICALRRRRRRAALEPEQALPARRGLRRPRRDPAGRARHRLRHGRAREPRLPARALRPTSKNARGARHDSGRDHGRRRASACATSPSSAATRACSIA